MSREEIYKEVIENIENIIKKHHNILIRIIGFYDFNGYKDTVKLFEKINELITQNEL